MANIDDSGDAFPDVYQLATTDPGVGGPPNDATGDGALNRPLRHLAQRTAWLKSRVETLLAAVGTAASTAVAGIVQLSDSVTSTATNLAATANAVKKANDNANTRVPQTRTVTGGGLATGGGSLDSNRTITVTAASNVDAIAGTRTDVAMTPAATRDALDNRFGALAMASLTAPGLTQLSDSVSSTATDRAATPSAVKQANDNANARAPSTRVISGGGLVTGGGDLSANRTLTVSPASGADALAGTSVDLAMTPAATKTVLDSRLASYAPGARTVSAAGLATGGGDLTANRTITVTKATEAEAVTGTRDDVALTPLGVKAAITAALAGYSTIPAGAVADFAMPTPPSGWLVCDGSAVSRSTYATLFAAIGTTWGAGNGSTTFNLPDFRGEFRRGWDNGRGVDPGRAFASAQAEGATLPRDGWGKDNLQPDYNIAKTVGRLLVGSGAYEINEALESINGANADNAATNVRPRNIAVLTCIKL